MKRYDNVPDNLQPIGAWTYFWLSVLYGIPVIGFIFLIIHAISGANINRRNYARSYFCILVIIIIVLVLLFAVPTFAQAISDLFAKFGLNK